MRSSGRTSSSCNVLERGHDARVLEHEDQRASVRVFLRQSQFKDLAAPGRHLAASRMHRRLELDEDLAVASNQSADAVRALPPVRECSTKASGAQDLQAVESEWRKRGRRRSRRQRRERGLGIPYDRSQRSLTGDSRGFAQRVQWLYN